MGFPTIGLTFAGLGMLGTGHAHLEPPGHLEPLRALLLRSPARKERLLEGGQAQAGVRDITGLGAAGAAPDPPAEEFCWEPAAGEGFPALPRALLRTTLHGHWAVCGRDPEPPPGSGPPCKEIFGVLQPALDFYTRRHTAAVPVLQGLGRGSEDILSPPAGTPPWGAVRGSPCPQALGLPPEPSCPCCLLPSSCLLPGLWPQLV